MVFIQIGANLSCINSSKMITEYQQLLNEYPFLTVVNYAGNEYLGIIQNIDTQIATMYVYDKIKDLSEKQKFLTLGE